MPAGRGRPLRAADMKKDVRILLVGERESPRAGGLAAAAILGWEEAAEGLAAQ